MVIVITVLRAVLLNKLPKKAFVFLLDFVRPEMKFENREELFARIAFDRDNAKSIAESWIESCGAETAALLGI